VTLGESGSEGGELCGRKSGSSFHAALCDELGGGGCAGGLLGLDDGELNICVKLPSPDADPETPGGEKPFEREGPWVGSGTGLVGSSALRGVGGCEPPTKIRVNSPGPRSPACSLGIDGGVLTGDALGRIGGSAGARGTGAAAGFD